MTTASTAARTEIRPRRTGFVHDTVSIARRAIRQLPRDIAFIGPTLFIPLFFLVINVASLSEAARSLISASPTRSSSCPSPSCSRSPV